MIILVYFVFFWWWIFYPKRIFLCSNVGRDWLVLLTWFFKANNEISVDTWYFWFVCLFLFIFLLILHTHVNYKSNMHECERKKNYWVECYRLLILKVILFFILNGSYSIKQISLRFSIILLNITVNNQIL